MASMNQHDGIDGAEVLISILFKSHYEHISIPSSSAAPQNLMRI
jgi:hypothetical protein